MREIRVSEREIFRSYRKVYLNDLLKSLTPFILVDFPIHNDIRWNSPFCTLSWFDRQNLFKMMYIFHILINSADTDEMPLFGSSLFAKVPVYYYCLPVPRQLNLPK